jgi:hypothetical protein
MRNAAYQAGVALLAEAGLDGEQEASVLWDRAWHECRIIDVSVDVQFGVLVYGMTGKSLAQTPSTIAAAIVTPTTSSEVQEG